MTERAAPGGTPDNAVRTPSAQELWEAGREDERLRMARDLHDGALQDLHAIRLGVTAGANPHDVEADLLGVIREIRRVIEDLRPPALEAHGFRGALALLAARLKRRYPELDVRAEVGEGPVALPIPAQIALYRVAQEALANVAQHARAPSTAVSYREAGGRYLLTVTDDGVGFDPEAPATASRYGLTGARERARIAGGLLAVESAPGGGTRVTVAGSTA